MHFDSKYGWGYLVPGKPISPIDLELIEQEMDTPSLPYREVYEICEPVLQKLIKTETEEVSEERY